MKFVIFAVFASALTFTSCGSKKHDDQYPNPTPPKELELVGSVSNDADKALFTDWIVNGNSLDILKIENNGRVTRSLKQSGARKINMLAEAKSLAFIGKDDFKILQAAASIPITLRDGMLATSLPKFDGKYQIVNVNEAIIFSDAKKTVAFKLARKTPVVIIPAPAPAPGPAPDPAPVPVPQPVKRIETPEELRHKVVFSLIGDWKTEAFAPQMYSFFYSGRGVIISGLGRVTKFNYSVDLLQKIQIEIDSEISEYSIVADAKVPDKIILKSVKGMPFLDLKFEKVKPAGR